LSAGQRGEIVFKLGTEVTMYSEAGEQAMNRPGTWVKAVLVFSLVLTVCVQSAPAQSSRATLTVTIQLVPSTLLIVAEDGKARLIEANGPNGLTITTIDAPAKVGAKASSASKITSPQPQRTTQPSGTPAN
jgi:hypothetical protein